MNYYSFTVIHLGTIHATYMVLHIYLSSTSQQYPELLYSTSNKRMQQVPHWISDAREVDIFDLGTRSHFLRSKPRRSQCIKKSKTMKVSVSVVVFFLNNSYYLMIIFVLGNCCSNLRFYWRCLWGQSLCPSSSSSICSSPLCT